ncbi:hypothetical protein [Actinocorallia libanotica]|uniref:Uncharacterized protein n=1 Tax=Actinocorallia libanotica TaxID=46162 RepID=A0ABN1Q1L8_9ACTN
MTAQERRDAPRPVPADTPPPPPRPAAWVLLTPRAPRDDHHDRAGADG